MERFLSEVTDHLLGRGIAAQVEAFRRGFAQVCVSPDALRLFSPHELQRMVCGEACIAWADDAAVGLHHGDRESAERAALREYFERSNTAARVGAEHLWGAGSVVFEGMVDVLVGMSHDERQRFLEFTTSTPAFPLGGLTSLRAPKAPHNGIALVRKAGTDSSLVSASTCFFHLRLPPFSTTEVLRERLVQSVGGARGLIDLS